MKKGDTIFAIICMGLSLWLILESLQFDYLSDFGPGPGFEPFWLGVMLALLSIALLINTLRKKDNEEDDKPRLPGWKSLGRLGVIMLIMAGLALSMNTLEFILAVFIFVALILYILEKVSILKSVFYGIMFSGFIFLLFRYWMNIDLPKGFVGL